MASGWASLSRQGVWAGGSGPYRPRSRAERLARRSDSPLPAAREHSAQCEGRFVLEYSAPPGSRWQQRWGAALLLVCSLAELSAAIGLEGCGHSARAITRV